MSIYGYTNAPSLNTPACSLAELKETMERAKGIGREMRRSEGLLAEVQCPTCRRKVTVVDGGRGYVVCSHMYAAVKEAAAPLEAMGPIDILGGVRIYLDDVPRGW